MVVSNFSYFSGNELVFDWFIDYWEIVINGDMLFLMYFNVLVDCDQVSIDLLIMYIFFCILRGGQDVFDFQFVVGKVEIGVYCVISSDMIICVGDSFELYIDVFLVISLNWFMIDGLLSCNDCFCFIIIELYGEVLFSVEIEGLIGCMDMVYIFVNVCFYFDFGLLFFSNSLVCFGDIFYFDFNVFGG